MADNNITGWITVKGRRIPIRAKGEGKNREPDKDKLRKNMWGPRNGKRKDRYALPQKKNFTGDPDEDYVKKVMKEYGVGRGDAIRLIRE